MFVDMSRFLRDLCLPRQAVNVMTTMLPRIESAMIPDITRGARSLPKTSEKKRVAISRLLFRRWSKSTAQNCVGVSGLCVMLW